MRAMFNALPGLLPLGKDCTHFACIRATTAPPRKSHSHGGGPALGYSRSHPMYGSCRAIPARLPPFPTSPRPAARILSSSQSSKTIFRPGSPYSQLAPRRAVRLSCKTMVSPTPRTLGFMVGTVLLTRQRMVWNRPSGM